MNRKFPNDTKLGGVADMPEGCAVTQREDGKWSENNLKKFSKGNCKVLLLGRNNPQHQYMLRATQLESSFAEQALRVLVDTKLVVRQQCTLEQRSLVVSGLH